MEDEDYKKLMEKLVNTCITSEDSWLENQYHFRTKQSTVTFYKNPNYPEILVRFIDCNIFCDNLKLKWDGIVQLFVKDTFVSEVQLCEREK